MKPANPEQIAPTTNDIATIQWLVGSSLVDSGTAAEYLLPLSSHSLPSMSFDASQLWTDSSLLFIHVALTAATVWVSVSLEPLNAKSTATAITKIAKTLYSAFRNAIAPLDMLDAIVCIFSFPASCFETHAFL